MTLTHRDLATLTAVLYATSGGSDAYPALPSVEWLYRSPVGADCYFALIRIDDFLCVVSRGSFAFKDWIHDLQATAPVPYGHPDWGPVHGGFYRGIDAAWEIIKTYIKPTDKVIFIGHSLGAAHSILLAAHMKSDGGEPHMTVCWGEPKSGFQTLTDFLSDVPGISYQNGDSRHHDLVTEVPLSMPPMLYVHRFQLTRICARPASWIEADIGPFGWHHFSLYASVTPSTPIN